MAVTFVHRYLEETGLNDLDLGPVVWTGEQVLTLRGEPVRFIETFVVESWAEHLRQHERVTISDREIEARAFAFHQGPEPPKITHWIAASE